MSQELFKILQGVGRAFAPRRCCFCKRVLLPQEKICPQCLEKVERVPLPICFHCGCNKLDCKCKKRSNPFVSAFAAPFYYKGSVRESIHRLKFQQNKDNGEVLGEEMADFAEKVFPAIHMDLVTYVPMTPKEQKERNGLNQSQLLAQKAAEKLLLPCDGVLTKLYETQRQRVLSSDLRSGNVLGVFDVTDSEKIRGKRILLCDDICTTGATLTECAKMLMIYGAKEVLCLTAAVGFPKPDEKG